MTCNDCYWMQHDNCDGYKFSPRYCPTFIFSRDGAKNTEEE